MTYQPHPLRIQRKRTKGFKLPPGAVCVTRPGRWGNPFDSAERFDAVLMSMREKAFKNLGAIAGGDLLHMAAIAANLEELRGKPIACWCPLDRECHGDILAREANR